MQGSRVLWSLAFLPLRVSRQWPSAYESRPLQGPKGPFTGRIYDYLPVSYTAVVLDLPDAASPQYSSSECGDRQP